MSVLEIAFIGGVVAAFLSFAVVLGWVAHIDYTRPDPGPSGGED